MKKFQYFLLLVLFALPIKSFAQPFVQFSAQSTTVDCATNSLSIDIDVQDFIQMNAFDYSFHWDPTVLTLTSIDNPMVISNLNISQAGASIGTLTFGWFSVNINGSTIPDGTVITLNFDLIGNASQTSDFTFDNNPTFVNITQYGAALNSSQYTLTSGLLTITDTENPTITCPSGLPSFDTGGATTTQITGAAPTTNDNCDIDFVSYELTMNGTNVGIGLGDVSNNVNFEIGTTTVTYTVSDFGGNTETCSFDVIVTNNSGPSILTLSMDNNLQVNCESNTVSFNIYVDNFTDMRGTQFTLNWPSFALQYIDTSNYAISTGSTAFGTSNVSNGELIFSWSDAAGASLPNGTILFTIEFMVNSPAGITLPITANSEEFTNTTSFPFTMNSSEYDVFNGSIYIFDNVNPTITCPADVTVNSANGTDAVVTGIAPTTSDNCGVMDTVYTLIDASNMTIFDNGVGDASGSTFPVGTTIIEYIVTDFDGNQATCNFNVTVQVPGAITVTVDSIQVNCETNTVTIGMPVENFIDVVGVQFTLEWDNTELEFSQIIQDNFSPPGTFGLGNAPNGTMTFSWFDIGNPNTFADGSDIIQIEFNILDNTPGNSCDINFINAPVPYSVITQSSFPTNDPNAISEPGNIEIIDNTPPMITCPNDTIVNSGGSINMIVNDIGATATDNCGTPTISYVILSSPPIVGTGDASGNTFSVGTTTVTYTATDEAGNTTNCSFDVTVIQEQLDIQCPFAVNQSADAGACSATIADLSVNFISDPNNVSTITYTINNANGVTNGTGNIVNQNFIVGSSIVTYFVTDIFGNSEQCSFSVFINDVEGPVISGIPSDTTVECDMIPSPAMLTSIDACDGATSVTLINESTVPGPTPGSLIITRTWSTVDAEGNISTANQTITVIDTTNPVIVCPADITVVSSASSGCGSNVSWTVPTATDNCDTDVQVASPFTPGDFFGFGTTEITYYAIDDAGNIDSCKFNVTITDEDAPIFSNCPTDMIIPSGVACDTAITWTPPSVTDNCDNNVVVTVNIASGSVFMAGVETIIYTATDASGNSSTCSFTITVSDTEAPILVGCSGDITLPAGNNCSTVVSWPDPNVTDNCDMNPTLVSDTQSGSPFPVGIHPVTYTATDASGNISTCSFNVIITDLEPPSVFCPANVIVSSAGDIISDPNDLLTSTMSIGCDSVILTFDAPMGSDNCGIPLVTQTGGLTSGTTFGLGDHIIQFTATDASGNVNTVLCETTITVTSFVGLDISAAPDTLCTGESTQLFAQPITPVPGATCSWTGPNMFNSTDCNPILNNVSILDSGTYVITLTDPITNCTSTDSIEIVISQGPELALIANTVHCVDPEVQTDIPLSVLITNSVIADSVAWKDPNGTVFSNDHNTFISNATEAASGSYCVEVFDLNGCSNEVCETITITNIPNEPIINSACDDFICVGESCMLTGFADSDVDSIVWTATGNGPGLPADVNQEQIIVTPTMNGPTIYTYTVFKNGCGNSASILILVSSPASVFEDNFNVDFNSTGTTLDVIANDVIPGTLPGIFTINVTEGVNDGLLINNNDGTFNYTPNNGFLGNDQFIYEICLDCNDQTVCRWAIANITIVTDECLIPTVITPNDDDYNDTWEISCIKDNPENELIVYNRWGDEVYRALPYNNDWEGTYNNEPLPDGTYFYIFKTSANDTDPQKGTLNIIR